MVGKEAVKRIPVVGKAAELFGCVFVKRDDNDSKRNLFNTLLERMKLIE